MLRSVLQLGAVSCAFVFMSLWHDYDDAYRGEEEDSDGDFRAEMGYYFELATPPPPHPPR